MAHLHTLCDGSLDEALAQLPDDARSERVYQFFQRPDVALFWIAGNCPVQAEGQFKGRAFDFRARGQRWIVCVAGPTAWSFEAPYGSAAFDAGWMEPHEAIGFIMDALELWDLASRTQHQAA
jgi:hypothetical protein